MFKLVFFPGLPYRKGGEIHTAFQEESESEVKKVEIIQTDFEMKENHPKLVFSRVPSFGQN